MSLHFEEIDHCETPLGTLTLRRRRIPMLDNQEVHEVILNEEFLMSSLFHEAEEALARLGLEACQSTLGEMASEEKRQGSDALHETQKGQEPGTLQGGTPACAVAPQLDVVVGGLGLGYTARAALAHPNLRSLMVVDALAEVIGWHEAGQVPLGSGLSADPRCRLIHADFFALVASEGLDPEDSSRRFHAILLDIDHTPRHLLHPENAAFYQEAGLRRLAGHLHPGGIFAMWADGLPDPDFLASLGEVFLEPRGEVVTFENPIQDSQSSSTVYLGRRR